MIPKVRVEVEFTEPKNIIEEGVIGKWIIGEEADDSYKIRYDFRPKDADHFVKTAKDLLKASRTSKIHAGSTYQ